MYPKELFTSGLRKKNKMICKNCKKSVLDGFIRFEKEENGVILYSSRCLCCGCSFFVIENRADGIRDIFYPQINRNVVKTDSKRVFSSYIPSPIMIKENRELIEKEKVDGDIVVGFDGWEDVVIEKKLAYPWYMTKTSPPILDVVISDICFSCCAEDVVYSFPPSVLCKVKYRLLGDRDKSFFSEMEKYIFSNEKTVYIGVKNE